MRILLILAGMALSLAAASQEIYRWVDKNGQVHYSDQPDSPNAELINVIEPNAYEAVDAAQASSSGEAEEADEPGVSPYDSLSIVQPTPEQVFLGSDVVVTVVADLQGTLRPDHSVVFFLNGNRRQGDGLSAEFSGLARGTYFLRASILDQNGDPVVTSQQTNFHVRQASTKNPQTPVPGRPQLPTPKPTPKPATPPAGT